MDDLGVALFLETPISQEFLDLPTAPSLSSNYLLQLVVPSIFSINSKLPFLKLTVRP